jgi:hypothetical protein
MGASSEEAPMARDDRLQAAAATMPAFMRIGPAPSESLCVLTVEVSDCWAKTILGELSAVLWWPVGVVSANHQDRAPLRTVDSMNLRDAPMMKAHQTASETALACGPG